MSDAPNIPILAGRRVTQLALNIPAKGPWFADCVLDDDDPDGKGPLSGRQTLTFGDTQLRGTIAPSFTGSFIGQPTYRLVAGAGGWSTTLPPKAYHNDAGVKSAVVLAEAAQAAGETLGQVSPARKSLPSDYVRTLAPAARTVDYCAQGADWWVDFDGVTHIGTRPAPVALPEDVMVIDYDPRAHVVTLGLTSLVGLSIGQTITDTRIPGTLVVREIEAFTDGDSLKARLWCGGAEGSHSRTADALAAIVRQSTDQKLPFKYRYRVISQNSDGRLNLQAVAKASHPNLLLVPVRMGVPGVSAEHTPGTEVLVEFIEGDPTLPIITSYPDQRDSAFLPTALTLGANPSDNPPAAARVSDVVKVVLPPAICTVVVAGVPSPGTIIFTPSYTLGQIMTGSDKVRIGT